MASWAETLLWFGTFLAVSGLTILVLYVPTWLSKRKAERRAKQPGILRDMLAEEAKRRGEQKRDPNKPPSGAPPLNLHGV